MTPSEIKSDDDLRKFLHEAVDLLIDFETDFHLTENHKLFECIGKEEFSIALKFFDSKYEETMKRELNLSYFASEIARGNVATFKLLIQTWFVVRFYNKWKKERVTTTMNKLYQDMNNDERD